MVIADRSKQHATAVVVTTAAIVNISSNLHNTIPVSQSCATSTSRPSEPANEPRATRDSISRSLLSAKLQKIDMGDTSAKMLSCSST